jgi:hypothetical protein
MLIPGSRESHKLQRPAEKGQIASGKLRFINVRKLSVESIICMIALHGLEKRQQMSKWEDLFQTDAIQP